MGAFRCAHALVRASLVSMQQRANHDWRARRLATDCGRYGRNVVLAGWMSRLHA